MQVELVDQAIQLHACVASCGTSVSTRAGMLQVEEVVQHRLIARIHYIRVSTSCEERMAGLQATGRGCLKQGGALCGCIRGETTILLRMPVCEVEHCLGSVLQ
jgi:hypothetical protein